MRRRPPKKLKHVHIYDEKGFRCVECGHELNKALESKIREYLGPALIEKQDLEEKKARSPPQKRVLPTATCHFTV